MTRAPLTALNRLLPSLVFFALLSVPLVFLDHPGFAPAGLQENRRPEPFPSYSLLWLKKLERWFDDHFGLRATLVHYGARLNMALLDQPTHPNVVLGTDGWLFYDERADTRQPLFADYRGRRPFGATELARITDNLRRTQQALAGCGIGFYLAMPPDKQTIYADRMPLRRDDAVRTRADQLFAHLQREAPTLAALDLRPALHAARAAEAIEVYKRTDTHWNALGAFHGYRAIAGRLLADGAIAASPQQRRDAYTVTPIAYEGGDIAVSMLSLPGYFPDRVIDLRPAPPRRAQPAAPPPALQALIAPDAVRLFAVRERPEARGTLFLFRDSYSDELLPFLAEDFARTVALYSHVVDGAQVRAAGATVVVLQVLERLLDDLLKPAVRLEQACGG